MSLQRLNRSPELQRLRDENYDVLFVNGHLMMRNVPYVSDGGIQRGCLVVAQLSMAGDVTAKPENHEMLWVGASPRDIHRRPLPLGERNVRVELADGYVAERRFSFKPRDVPNGYKNYYEMFTTYYALIAGQAEAVEPQLVNRTLGPYVPDGSESVFNYHDTATSRAGIPEATRKLELDAIAIVGLGGTGSYILDNIAKAPSKAIHLYDDDVFLTHNAFRSPGAPTCAELEKIQSKVEYFAEKYSAMHRNIIGHAERITEQNVECLRAMDFVFISIDSGGARQMIIQRLEEWGIPFIDVGMGLLLNEDASIAGLVRTTASIPGRESPCAIYCDYSEGEDNLYKRNIQTADLNMLNAALAVIKFKKMRSFYHDDQCELQTTYVVSGNSLANAVKP